MHSCIIDRIDRYIDKNIFNASSMTTNENCERLYLIPLPVNSNSLVLGKVSSEELTHLAVTGRMQSSQLNSQHFSFPPNVTKFPSSADIGNFSSYTLHQLYLLLLVLLSTTIAVPARAVRYSLAPTATLWTLLRKITKICKFVLAKSRSRQTICWLRDSVSRAMLPRMRGTRMRMRNCCHFTSALIKWLITRSRRRSLSPSLHV